MATLRRTTAVALAAVTLAVVGCGGNNIHPVRGKVVFEDGTPVPGIGGAKVVFENTAPDGKSYSSAGEIEDDGSFRMTTDTPNDGAVVGTNRVLIERRMLDPERYAPRVIDEKYERLETSGLTFEVKPGGNEYTLKVTPPAKKEKK